MKTNILKRIFIRLMRDFLITNCNNTTELAIQLHFCSSTEFDGPFEFYAKRSSSAYCRPPLALRQAQFMTVYVLVWLITDQAPHMRGIGMASLPSSAHAYFSSNSDLSSFDSGLSHKLLSSAGSSCKSKISP